MIWGTSQNWEKQNKHSLAHLGKAVENKNRNTTWNIYNFGLQQILDLFEIFWELKREREREPGNIVGNIRDISGKPFWLGTKLN